MDMEPTNPPAPNPPAPPRDARPSRRRGFAILIVLAVIAMASTILATQLSAVRGQEISQLRMSEELKARDIAELCLEVADAYAQDWGLNEDDFDGILDPNGTIEAAGDDFMPPATLIPGTSGVVVIPPGATGSKYRYRAFQISVTAAGGTSGTCFIRYDDNNDDTSTILSNATTGNTNGVPEGGDVDVPERDRDRSVVMTAIGAVPQRGSLQDSYDDAHARVTLRRVRAMPIAVTIGAAIQAGGTVDFDGDICGSVGGVIADRVQGGLCVCGPLDAELVSGSQGSCTCPASTCAPTTNSDITAGDRAAPTITIPAYGSLLKNESFGAVGTTTGVNIAAASYEAAVVLVRSANAPGVPLGYMPILNSTDVYVWDKFDNDTATTLGVGPVTNCTDTTSLDPLPPPCKWDPGAAALANRLTCAAGETPCWKLVARLGDGVNADIDIRAATINDHANTGGAPSTSFAPQAGDLPNVRLPAGAGSAEWRDFTNNTSSTSGANGTFNIVTPSGATSTSFTVANNDTGVTRVPNLYIAIDSTATSTTTISGLNRTGAKMSVSTNNIVVIAGSTQCCTTCTCPSACSSTTTMTAATNGPGYAIRTSEPCSDSAAIGVIGNIMCGQLDVSNTNGNCVVGGMIGIDAPGNIACNLPGTTAAIDAICNTQANFCAKNNFDIIGNLTCAGNICLKNNLDMNGGVIQTQASIGWKNNPVAAGQILAGVDVLGKNNATIIFNGTSGSANNQGVPSSLWMDSTW